MQRLWYSLGFGLLVLVIGLLALYRPTRSTGSEFTVVTTFYPLTQLVTPIVGEAGSVTQLIPSGQSVHDYRPTPSDIQLLQKADLLIVNGAGLEHEWLESLVESVGRSDLPTLDLTQALESAGVELLEGESDEHESDLRDPTSEIRTDPHVWLSPKNALVMIEAIRDELVRRNPGAAATYQANADAFDAKLAQLDADITAEIGTFSSHEFIAFHNAFSYFARDYGLEQIGVVELTPGEEPTPGQVVELQTLIRSNRLRAIYSEPQYSSALVDQLAADLGVGVLVLDPLETGDPAEGYVAGMRRNLAALAKGLQ